MLDHRVRPFGAQTQKSTCSNGERSPTRAMHTRGREETEHLLYAERAHHISICGQVACLRLNLGISYAASPRFAWLAPQSMPREASRSSPTGRKSQVRSHPRGSLRSMRLSGARRASLISAGLCVPAQRHFGRCSSQCHQLLAHVDQDCRFEELHKQRSSSSIVACV